MLVNHSYVFDIEKNFDFHSQSLWVREHYFIPLSTIAAYLVVIFGLQLYMKTREAFRLRKYLVLWNASLAVFSLCGVVRCFPHMYVDLRYYGFHHTVCSRSNYQSVGVFWAWLFSLSKFVELGDTIFIVLRKKKLIFLHWYHHVTILLGCWIAFADLAPPGLWFVNLNYPVHVFMYSYYTIRILKIKTPKRVAMFVTTLQILQMVAAVYVTTYIYIVRQRGLPCEISAISTNYNVAVACSYLLLFLKFFYETYILTDKSKKRKTT